MFFVYSGYLIKMQVFFSVALFISIVHCHHGGHIDTSIENERPFYLFENENHKLTLINILQPAIEIEVQYSDITFYYYSRNNKNSPIKISGADFDGIIDPSYFDPQRVTFFLTHGYTGSFEGSIGLIRHKDGLLEADDCNVFIIDWSRISHEFYTTSVQAVPKLGSIIATCIDKLVVNYNISLSMINLVGHSLGTHVLGSVGAYFKGDINSIVAMDPALPLFNHNDFDKRLDTTDAKHVHVIHTNAGLLGFKNALGHADYYPNKGGINQPNCGSDLFGTCAHSRAPELYDESIRNSAFRAVSCDSYEEYETGLCDNNPFSYMGGYLIDTRAHGTYYLKTAEYPPYALG